MENKVAVIYKSKYGTTKRYAGWIALKLDADLYELSDFREKDLAKYETIIYGGSIYAGKVKGLEFVTKNYESIKNKNLILFTVGLRSIDEVDYGILNEVKKFYFKGKLDYSELSLLDKVLMKGLTRFIGSKNDLSDDDKMILEAMKIPKDFTDKKAVNSLVDYVTELI